MDNVLITMSGGTTSVINATLCGIIQTARSSGRVDRIYAGVPGIEGVLAESFADLSDISVEQLSLLYYTPASGYIGTTRIRPMEEEALYRLAEICQAYRIRYFINIGGNGTIRQSMAISRSLSPQVQVASVAKTVDNDLGDAKFEKVLYTPGFPSCVNYWRNKVWIMNQENLGACSHDKVLVAQTFGRKTGFLAGAARLGDIERQVPLLLLLPEDQQPLDAVLSAIDKTVSRYGRAIVILSEGYELGDLGERCDLSGQVMYGTCRTTAAQMLVNQCADNGIQARAFIPGFDQRSDSNFVSELDLERAYQVGRFTVKGLLDGRRDFLGSISRNPWHAEEVDLSVIPFDEIGTYSRVMPKEWITPGGFDVSDDYLDYVFPLIGRTRVGLPHVDGQLLFAEPTHPHMTDRAETTALKRALV